MFPCSIALGARVQSDVVLRAVNFSKKYLNKNSCLSQGPPPLPKHIWVFFFFPYYTASRSIIFFATFPPTTFSFPHIIQCVLSFISLFLHKLLLPLMVIPHYIFDADIAFQCVRVRVPDVCTYPNISVDPSSMGSANLLIRSELHILLRHH